MRTSHQTQESSTTWGEDALHDALGHEFVGGLGDLLLNILQFRHGLGAQARTKFRPAAILVNAVQLLTGQVHFPRNSKMLPKPFDHRQISIDLCETGQSARLKLHDQGRVDLILATEMLVDRTFAHFGLLRDLIDRDVHPVVGFEQRQRSRQDVLTPAFKFSFFPGLNGYKEVLLYFVTGGHYLDCQSRNQHKSAPPCCSDRGARVYLCVGERTGASRKAHVGDVVLLRTWPDSLQVPALVTFVSASFLPITNGSLPSSISFACSPGTCFTWSRKDGCPVGIDEPMH